MKPKPTRGPDVARQSKAQRKLQRYERLGIRPSLKTQKAAAKDAR